MVSLRNEVSSAKATISVSQNLQAAISGCKADLAEGGMMAARSGALGIRDTLNGLQEDVAALVRSSLGNDLVSLYRDIFVATLRSWCLHFEHLTMLCKKFGDAFGCADEIEQLYARLTDAASGS